MTVQWQWLLRNEHAKELFKNFLPNIQKKSLSYLLMEPNARNFASPDFFQKKTEIKNHKYCKLE